MNQEELERLVNKSDRQLFINDLNTGFGLSQVEAEALYDRITLFNRDYYNSSRGPGQITKTVVALGEPAGKPIKYCRMVSVNLTILHDEDIEIRQKYGIAAERRNKELRLCDEAIDQGGVSDPGGSCNSSRYKPEHDKEGRRLRNFIVSFIDKIKS